MIMLFLIIIMIVFKIASLKATNAKIKKILKTRLKAKHAKLQYKLFSSKQLFFNYIERELVKITPYYKLKIIDDILTKVKCNVPQTYGNFIDTKCLKNCGLNQSLPIYIANKNEIKYVCEAMKYTKFYCILFDECEVENTEYIKVFSRDSISLAIFNTLHLLNINYGKVCKINLCENKEEIGINNKQLLKTEFFDGKFLYFYYSLDNIDIEIKKYYNQGLFYNIKIKNNCNQIQSVSININKKIRLDIINYYLFKTTTKTLKMFDISGQIKNFVFSNAKLKFRVSQINEMQNSNFPMISAVNNIKIQPYQTYEYNLLISPNICENLSFKQNEFDYIAKVCKRFKVKIKSQNKKIDMLLNKTLPQNIILDEIYQIEENDAELNNTKCFKEVFEMFNAKKISNKKMYEFMLEHYIGFKETATLYILNPKTEFDFCLYIDDKMIEIKYGGGKKYIEIDGIRYFNISCIFKNSFLLSSKILLVI